MGANLKTMFVVDVEATCWNGEDGAGKPNEVIEIGIVALDVKTRNIVDKRGYVVKPRFTEVSPFCTELTGWTQEAIDKGQDIAVVLHAVQADFKITRNNVWWSYGEYDRYKLSANPLLEGSLGSLYGIKDSPFDMRAHYNAKTLLAIKLALPKELGMARALTRINRELEGRHHNGADDAANIAKIVRFILG